MQERDLEPKPVGTKDDNYRLKAGVFLAAVSGMSAVAGFGYAVASAKRRDPVAFQPPPGASAVPGSARVAQVAPAALAEGGAALAVRALAWGSLYAVAGVSLISVAIWKLSGARDLKEFRNIVGSALPRITNKESSGRTEFEGFSDLLQYVLSEDERKKTNG